MCAEFLNFQLVYLVGREWEWRRVNCVTVWEILLKAKSKMHSTLAQKWSGVRKDWPKKISLKLDTPKVDQLFSRHGSPNSSFLNHQWAFYKCKSSGPIPGRPDKMCTLTRPSEESYVLPSLSSPICTWPRASPHWEDGKSTLINLRN